MLSAKLSQPPSPTMLSPIRAIRRSKRDTAMQQRRWNQNEDSKLTDVVQIMSHDASCANEGPMFWNRVSALLKLHNIYRINKQCKERWLNNICPDINHEVFTESEENLIEEHLINMPYKWAAISRHFPGHTAGQVKNFCIKSGMIKRLAERKLLPERKTIAAKCQRRINFDFKEAIDQLPEPEAKKEVLFCEWIVVGCLFGEHGFKIHLFRQSSSWNRSPGYLDVFIIMVLVTS